LVSAATGAETPAVARGTGRDPHRGTDSRIHEKTAEQVRIRQFGPAAQKQRPPQAEQELSEGAVSHAHFSEDVGLH
jgi:hypothetical protein